MTGKTLWLYESRTTYEKLVIPALSVILDSPPRELFLNPGVHRGNQSY